MIKNIIMKKFHEIVAQEQQRQGVGEQGDRAWILRQTAPMAHPGGSTENLKKPASGISTRSHHHSLG